MRIVSLVNNKCLNNSLQVSHGMSIYIETLKHKILFDLGQNESIFKNAKELSINLNDVDTVIISHGHYDHALAIKEFLNINKHAKVYIQKTAFGNFYSKRQDTMHYIGLDKDLTNHKQLVLLDGNMIIDDELEIFKSKRNDLYYSNVNDNLYEENNLDKFNHEQNLIINGKVLFCGCGHNGIVNILESTNDNIETVIGGFHLYSESLKKNVTEEILVGITNYLSKKDINIYTCHCTGEYAYKYFKDKHLNINYLYLGDELELK